MFTYKIDKSIYEFLNYYSIKDRYLQKKKKNKK